MSMLGMLGKVAMGIMVAKTVGKAMGGSGGVGDMLGGLLGGGKKDATSSTGMGDLLGNLTGNQQNSGGLGDLLSSALQGKEVNAAPSEEEKAKIILKAMISAAKADGKLDADEQAKITQHIGEVTPEELAFVKEELEAPLDVDAIIKSVPKGMEQEVYLMSLLTINLDSSDEAQYLDKLAKGLDISAQIANAIHEKVGAQKLYS